MKPIEQAQPLLAPAPTACWKQIGVYGSGSCPELPQQVHCRNCPVYSKAGVQLLNRPLPADYRRDWSQHFAARKRLTEPGSVSALLFRVGPEWLALPTQVVQEIAERRPIHSLPHRPQGLVLGLTNVRGELLICVSLGHLLGHEPLAPPTLLRRSYARLLTTLWEAQRLAFPVDEVYGPHRFHLHELKPLAAPSGPARPGFAQGILPWQQRLVGCLNAELLFSTLNRSLS